MADTDLAKAMAGMSMGDQYVKENNGDGGGLKQPVNGKIRITFGITDRMLSFSHVSLCIFSQLQNGRVLYRLS